MLLNSPFKTAILVFANSSQEEAKHKKISNSNKLFDALTAQTLKTVEKSQLPYFHFSENEQEGTTFGERFTKAIEIVFNKGYDFIITLGNDTPQLKVAHILEAERQVQSNKFVLGPSTDGGFYLMGLSKSQFERTNFKKLNWQTSSLYKQLFDQISNLNTSIFKLERLCDIDATVDVRSILKFTFSLSDKIRDFLLQTQSLARLPSTLYLTYFTSFYYATFFNKGSPLVFHS